MTIIEIYSVKPEIPDTRAALGGPVVGAGRGELRAVHGQLGPGGPLLQRAAVGPARDGRLSPRAMYDCNPSEGEAENK